MLAEGTAFSVTVSCAALLVAVPNAFDTTTSKNAPLSASWMLERV